MSDGGITGMNIGQVRHLASTLSNTADQIETLVNTLSHQVGGVVWRGHDADQFRSDWDTRHRSQLLAVAHALRDTSGVATRNANEQEQAASH
jgi:hypothetical protein